MTSPMPQQPLAAGTRDIETEGLVLVLETHRSTQTKHTQIQTHRHRHRHTHTHTDTHTDIHIDTHTDRHTQTHTHSHTTHSHVHQSIDLLKPKGPKGNFMYITVSSVNLLKKHKRTKYTTEHAAIETQLTQLI